MSRQEVRKKKRSDKRTSKPAPGTSSLRVAPEELHYGVGVSQPFSSGPARRAKTLVIYDHDLPPGSLPEHGTFYIDTETDGLEPRRDRLRLLTICDSNNNLILVRNPDHLSSNLIWSISYRNVVFHHSAFDTRFILWWMGHEFDPYAIKCTKTLAKATGQFEHSGLNSLVKNVLDVDLAKKKEVTVSDWNVKYLSKEQIEYACLDVLYLADLRKELNKRLVKLNRVGIASDAEAMAAGTAYLELKGYSDVLAYDSDPNEKLRKLWDQRCKQIALDKAIGTKKRVA